MLQARGGFYWRHGLRTVGSTTKTVHHSSNNSDPTSLALRNRSINLSENRDHQPNNERTTGMREAKYVMIVAF